MITRWLLLFGKECRLQRTTDWWIKTHKIVCCWFYLKMKIWPITSNFILKHSGGYRKKYEDFYRTGKKLLRNSEHSKSNNFDKFEDWLKWLVPIKIFVFWNHDHTAMQAPELKFNIPLTKLISNKYIFCWQTYLQCQFLQLSSCKRNVQICIKPKNYCTEWQADEWKSPAIPCHFRHLWLTCSWPINVKK